MKVTFLPEQKLISILSGNTQIDVQVDLYSNWKEWVKQGDNAKWAAAFRTIGGDPTGPNQYAPSYYFLINGWKVHVSNMSISVQTNLYSDDGLSPFIVENNAAVTNKTSDVPIIKSEMEKRLDYGDRVYYDETSSYVGTSYPNGTIAQPVNNISDAISISNIYNISNFYCLSDVNITTTGNTFENYSIFACKENLKVNIINGNYLNNMIWKGLIIDGYFGGGVNHFDDCIIINALDVSGQMKGCQINGTTRIWENMVTSLCYNGVAKGNSPIPISVWDMHPINTTNLSLRSYSGGVTLLNCNNTGDTATIELIAGRVVLQPTCTSGYVEIRGVGYLTNNSSGSTIKTNGFVSEFPLTSEDIDKLGSLTGLTELLALTGITEQLNSIESGITITNENVLMVNEDVWSSPNIYLSGDTMGSLINNVSKTTKTILGLTV